MSQSIVTSTETYITVFDRLSIASEFCNLILIVCSITTDFPLDVFCLDRTNGK